MEKRKVKLIILIVSLAYIAGALSGFPVGWIAHFGGQIRETTVYQNTTMKIYSYMAFPDEGENSYANRQVLESGPVSSPLTLTISGTVYEFVVIDTKNIIEIIDGQSFKTGPSFVISMDENVPADNNGWRMARVVYMVSAQWAN